MKTSVEINGYLITIEEIDGVISVNAAKDDEVVEEFTINIDESGDDSEGKEIDVKPFGEYDEEDDFNDDDDDSQGDVQDEIEDDIQDELQDDEEGDDDDDDDDNDDNELQGRALESFQSFINKKK